MKKRKQQATIEALPSQMMSNIEELMTTILEVDDDTMLKVVDAIGKLSQEDKRILCHYAELRSFRKMADVLGASASTWGREIARIRKYFAKI